MCRRKCATSTKAVTLLKLMVFVAWWCQSGMLCCGRKEPTLVFSTYSSLRSPKPLAATNAKAPIVLGTRFNRHKIPAWAPEQASRSDRAHRHPNNRSFPCVGYYIPTTSATGSSRSALFSQNFEPIESRINTRDVFSFLGDFRYGANRVHKDFVGLSWTIYGKTILWTAPFVVLLFIVLPRWYTSSSPTLQLLARKIQDILSKTIEILAKGAHIYFSGPVGALAQRILSWWPLTRASGTQKSAWKSDLSRTKILIWALSLGPIVEELVFRLAFRSFWKRLFRPIAIESNSNGGEEKYSGNRHIERIKSYKTLTLVPRMPFFKLLSSNRSLSRQSQKSKPMSANRSWRIASGILFAIAHFPNLFPINLSRYDIDGEIRLPSETTRERFLLQLFPGDFASQSANKEFCLISFALVGAIYQAMHCFIATMVLYGPLLDSKSTASSTHGGIFATIGAHIAWNANALWLDTNIKLRLLFKLVLLPLFRGTQQQNHKRQDPPESSRASRKSSGDKT